MSDLVTSSRADSSVPVSAEAALAELREGHIGTAVVGRDPGVHEWNVRDGRITELGLHCVVDLAMGNDVIIAVRANGAGQQAPR